MSVVPLSERGLMMTAGTVALVAGTIALTMEIESARHVLAVAGGIVALLTLKDVFVDDHTG